MKRILSTLLTGAMLLLSAGAQAAMHDAGSLEWRLWGFRPNVWRMNFDFSTLGSTWAEVDGIPMEVPGSVQKALLSSGILRDWNYGTRSREAEWVENREWLLGARIPDGWIARTDPAERVILSCRGLDYRGIVLVNGREAGRFGNAFLPYRFDITSFLRSSGNTVVLVFECPPENLAQIGWTSRITTWKPRFNYGWDWAVRFVQTGVWDTVSIGTENPQRARLEPFQILTGADPSKERGSMTLRFDRPTESPVRVRLTSPQGKAVLDKTLPAGTSSQTWEGLRISRWWPNGCGAQPLYRLSVDRLLPDGSASDSREQRIGFRTIAWQPCKDASPESDPWLCTVNGKPVFLQGVNWTPILLNFADLGREDYRKLLQCYKDLGANTIRIWGGGFAERDWLYDLCDETGILVWQDFPLSSSGLDNYPPEEAQAIASMQEIVDHYLLRLRNHTALLLWCGGNELYQRGDVAPITTDHPMVAMMASRVERFDAGRRFVPGTPSGPVIYSSLDNFGSGRCYDVHGPWNMPYTDPERSLAGVEAFWSRCDALFISEAGVPGAESADLLEKYSDALPLLPADASNPYWKSVNWWIQWQEYLAKGGNPTSIDDYVAWSQQRQVDGLSIALRINKARFPACGGFLIWMGHDSFPCPVNTSLIDFDGHLKPAALAVSAIWKTDPADL